MVNMYHDEVKGTEANGTETPERFLEINDIQRSASFRSYNRSDSIFAINLLPGEN